MTFFRNAGPLRSVRNWQPLRGRSCLLALLCLFVLAAAGIPKAALAQAPVPLVKFKPVGTPGEVPSDVLIGEKFKFQVEFSNTGTIGYGPYIELYLQARGIDSNSVAQKCDGISFSDANALFTSPPILSLNTSQYKLYDSGLNFLQCPNTINSPFAAVPGWIAPTPLPLALTDYQLVVVLLPFGSFDPTQPKIDIDVEALVSDFADAGSPLNICVRGGFRFGADALNNPVSDPLVQSGTPPGTLVCATTKPAVFKIKKEYLGLEDETATGPNFPSKYKITVDIATGQPIKSLKVFDILPNNMAYAGNVSVTATPPLPVPGVVNQPPLNVPSNPTNNVLELTWGGQTGIGVPGTDVTVTFDFFIPEKDADGMEILNDCTPKDVINGLKVSGNWSPLDPRDSGSGGIVTGSNPTAHELKAKCTTIQKSVQVFTDTGAAGLTPGDALQYTLKFQISDYHTIGRELKVTDILGDGQEFPFAGMLAPTLRVTDQFGTTSGNFTLNTNLTATPDPFAMCKLPCPAGGVCPAPIQGGTVLQFDISSAMTTLPQTPPLIPRHDNGILTGGHAAGLPLSSTPATGEIVFYAKIKDKFDYQHSGTLKEFVDKHDPMCNNVVIEGEVYKNVVKPTPINAPINIPTPIIGKAKDDSATVTSIVFGKFTKSVYAIKRGPNFVCGGSSSACVLPPAAPRRASRRSGHLPPHLYERPFQRYRRSHNHRLAALANL